MTLTEAKDIFTIGEKIRCRHPFNDGEPVLVHILDLIPCYSNKTFVHYKVYGRYRQWWHEFFDTAETLEGYIDRKI